MIMEDSKLKEMFVKMCSLSYFDGDVMYFPAEDVEFIADMREIRENENYSILLEKMETLMNMINDNPTLIEKDIETELWYMI